MEKTPAYRHIAKADAWFAIAQRVRAEIEATPSAVRKAAYRRLVGEIGLSLTTLTWMVSASRFVEHIRKTDDALARALSTSTMSAVNILDRWAKRDPDGALTIAHRFVAEHMTLAQLNALDRDGRKLKARSVITSAERLPAERRENIVDAVIRLVQQKIGPGYKLAWASQAWAPRFHSKRSFEIKRFLKVQRYVLAQLALTAPDAPPVIVSLHVAKPANSQDQLRTRTLGAIALIESGYRSVLVLDQQDDFDRVSDMVHRWDLGEKCPIIAMLSASLDEVTLNFHGDHRT